MDAILPDLGKALIGLGPGGVFGAIMWWMWKGERDERRDLQEKLFVIGKTSIEGDMKVADAINGIRQEMIAGRAK